MTFRFIHASDIHLGYEQYNLAARADDFARAYFGVVDHAIDVRADFVLIGGDLFHHSHSDALTVRQAMVGLTQLRSAGIPVVAVEGNHDTTYSQKRGSWMRFLCDEEYLYLLNVRQHPNGHRALVPFDMEDRLGSYVDLAGVRIYGLKYHGAATARLLEEVGPQIEPGPGGYTILMLHAGMEGQIPYLHGGLTMSQVAPLRDRVDYLALGHIHKRLTPDNWIHNPGSTETNSMEEIDWDHGFFDVQVDPAAPVKHVVTPVETKGLRPFRRIRASAEGFESLDAFVAAAEERIAAAQLPDNAVVELHLGGVAEFRRQDVPVERLRGAIETRFSPLTVRVHNALIPPGPVSVKRGDHTPRAELERQVVEYLVRQTAEYRDSAVDWTKLILEVKNMAIEHDLPASVADHIRAFMSRLPDEITAGTDPLKVVDDVSEDRVSDDAPRALETETLDEGVPVGLALSPAEAGMSEFEDW